MSMYGPVTEDGKCKKNVTYYISYSFMFIMAYNSNNYA